MRIQFSVLSNFIFVCIDFVLCHYLLNNLCITCWIIIFVMCEVWRLAFVFFGFCQPISYYVDVCHRIVRTRILCDAVQHNEIVLLLLSMFYGFSNISLNVTGKYGNNDFVIIMFRQNKLIKSISIFLIVLVWIISSDKFGFFGISWKNFVI